MEVTIINNWENITTDEIVRKKYADVTYQKSGRMRNNIISYSVLYYYFKLSQIFAGFLSYSGLINLSLSSSHNFAECFSLLTYVFAATFLTMKMKLAVREGP